MRWITSKYVSVSTALEINNRNKELFTLAINEITRELVKVLLDQKVVIQQVIDNSKVIKGLNSVKTLWDLKKGVNTLETVEPKETTINADGEEDPRGETKLVYVPVSKTVKLVFSNPSLKAARLLDKHPGFLFLILCLCVCLFVCLFSVLFFCSYLSKISLCDWLQVQEQDLFFGSNGN